MLRSVIAKNQKQVKLNPHKKPKDATGIEQREALNADQKINRPTSFIDLPEDLIANIFGQLSSGQKNKVLPDRTNLMMALGKRYRLGVYPTLTKGQAEFLIDVFNESIKEKNFKSVYQMLLAPINYQILKYLKRLDMVINMDVTAEIQNFQLSNVFSAISTMHDLVDLRLSYQKMDENVKDNVDFSFLQKLTKLDILCLRNFSMLCDEDLQYFSPLKNLRILSLIKSSIVGLGISSLLKLQELKVLKLHGAHQLNDFNGIVQLKYLDVLILSDLIKMTNGSLDKLKKMDSLKGLCIMLKPTSIGMEKIFDLGHYRKVKIENSFTIMHKISLLTLDINKEYKCVIQGDDGL